MLFKKEKSFLKKAYAANKTLFFFIIFFMLGQLFFTFLKTQTFPFINYGMYSQRFEVPEYYEVMVLKLNDTKINMNTRPRFDEGFIVSTLNHYKKLYESGLADPMIKKIESKLNEKFGLRYSLYYEKLFSRLEYNPEKMLQYQRWLYYYIQQNHEADLYSISVDIEKYKFQQNQFKLENSERLFNYDSSIN